MANSASIFNLGRNHDFLYSLCSRGKYCSVQERIKRGILGCKIDEWADSRERRGTEGKAEGPLTARSESSSPFDSIFKQCLECSVVLLKSHNVDAVG